MKNEKELNIKEEKRNMIGFFIIIFSVIIIISFILFISLIWILPKLILHQG